MMITEEQKELHLKWLRGDSDGVRLVLSGAVLSGAVLRRAVLSGAVLCEADLRGAVLCEADLREAKNKIFRSFEWSHIMTAAHIDGSNRQITLFTDGKTVMISAGCFWGTVKEFTAKANSEEKHIYAEVVPAMCKAWLEALKAE